MCPGSRRGLMCGLRNATSYRRRADRVLGAFHFRLSGQTGRPSPLHNSEGYRSIRCWLGGRVELSTVETGAEIGSAADRAPPKDRAAVPTPARRSIISRCMDLANYTPDPGSGMRPVPSPTTISENNTPIALDGAYRSKAQRLKSTTRRKSLNLHLCRRSLQLCSVPCSRSTQPSSPPPTPFPSLHHSPNYHAFDQKACIYPCCPSSLSRTVCIPRQPYCPPSIPIRQ